VDDQSRKVEGEAAAGRALSRGRVAGRSPSIEEIRRELGARLRQRTSEIETAIFARISALSEPVESGDPEYIVGLRAAVGETVEYGITSIERGAEWTPPPPTVVAVQAQRAARNGVSLDTVLRRYAAGDRIVGEFIVEEADRLPGQAVGQVMKARGPLVDGLMAYAATQYMREMERLTRSPEQRQGELVEKLLAGEAGVDPTELDYEFGGWHLGMIVSGESPLAAVRAAARDLNRPALVISRGTRTAWAWLGGRRLDLDEMRRPLEAGGLAGVSLAVGEPRLGFEGWRLTHEEALAGFQVMLRKPQRLVRGTDVLLLAAMLRDPVLAKSLLRTYLAPLDEHGDSGAVLRETLRAYFASDRNAATAAAVLEVDRHTVQRRLRKVEESLGRLLSECHLKLEVALALEEIGGVASLDEGVPES
jgi:hypothetical protein